MLTFHPGGGVLASRSWDGILRLWEPWRGREWLRVPMDANIRFSSDGRWFGVSTPGPNQCQLWEIAANPEYRSLGSSFGIGRAGFYEGDISPDGRWLTLGMQDGVRIWETSSGREVAYLPVGPSFRSLFRDGGRELITAGLGTGLLRWKSEKAAEVELRLGPPEPVPLPFFTPKFRLAAGGRTLAGVSETRGEAVVLNLGGIAVPVCRVTHTNSMDIALSPDGRWLATHGWHCEEVRLWDVSSGQLVHEWPGSRESRVCFTPDCRELVICRGDEFAFWDVGTLKTTRRLRREVPVHAGWVAFSDDGTLMAMELSPGIIDLKEVSTTRTVARLEDPFGDQSFWMAFTPGNQELVTVSAHSRAMHIWNLRTIRDNLEVLGLNTDWIVPSP